MDHNILSQFQTPASCCKYMVSLLPPGIVTVLEPTPGQGNIVKELSQYIVTAPANFWGVNGTFDAIVMNPPFTPMDVGYKILYRCMEMSNVIIALMPWLTVINSQNRTAKLMEYGLQSITHLPRNIFPGSRVQTCILNMCRGYTGECKFKLFTVKE
jgi:hypothetical protein